MFPCKLLLLSIISLIIIALIENCCVESRAISDNYQSDVIVTNWPTENPKTALEEKEEPGWLKRQLLKFGKAASRVGNAMGSRATKITAAVDKVCEFVKTIIPLLAAVCRVGQFKFCAATNEAPQQLTQALSPSSLDLNIPD